MTISDIHFIGKHVVNTKVATKKKLVDLVFSDEFEKKFPVQTYFLHLIGGIDDREFLEELLVAIPDAATLAEEDQVYFLELVRRAPVARIVSDNTKGGLPPSSKNCEASRLLAARKNALLYDTMKSGSTKMQLQAAKLAGDLVDVDRMAALEDAKSFEAARKVDNGEYYNYGTE